MDTKKVKENVKTEDDIIILGSPLEIYKYRKKIQIHQINFYYDWQKFTYWLGIFLQQYYVLTQKAIIPETLKEKEIKYFRDNIRTTILTSKLAHQALEQICKFTKIKKIFKLKWMRKKFNIDDWVEVFIWVYYYNIAGVKKNLKGVLSRIFKAQLN